MKKLLSLFTAAALCFSMLCVGSSAVKIDGLEKADIDSREMIGSVSNPGAGICGNSFIYLSHNSTVNNARNHSGMTHYFLDLAAFTAGDKNGEPVTRILKTRRFLRAR